MLDIRLIRENPAKVKELLLRKEYDASETVDKILELDQQRRDLIAKTEGWKAEQNAASRSIPQIKKNGGNIQEVLAHVSELKEAIRQSEPQLKAIEEAFRALMLSLPNLPDEDLLPGGKENNQPIRFFGEPKVFDFEPRHHVDLCNNLGLIDYERGVKLAGSGFWIYRGMGS